MDSTSQVLKFVSSTCAPCKILAKSLEELGALPVPLLTVAIDTPEGQVTASKFRIRNVPTLLALTDEGIISGTIVGSKSPKQLREWFKSIGVTV